MGPNQAVLDAIARLITNKGATVPARVSGEAWNTYVLRSLEAALTASGVTIPATAGNWNDRVAQLLGTLADGTTLALQPPVRSLADYVEADPSSQATATQATAGGLITITSAAVPVISNLPNLAATWSIPTKSLTGTTRDSDIYDLLSALILWTGNTDPPTADMRLMAGFADAPIATATIGWGVFLDASGADWQVGHFLNPAGTWTATAGSAANASTRGVRGRAAHVNGSTQRSICAVALDANSAPIVGNATVAATSAIGSDLDYAWFGFGWITGVGGTGGTQVTLATRELLLLNTEITGTARPSA